MTDQSVFREEEWRTHRHFLNPSKYKEYELHVSGLGFLNRINFIKDHYEKFTPIDEINKDVIRQLKRRTTIHIIRKNLSEEDKSLLEEEGFKLIKTWGTLILDLSRFDMLYLKLDSTTTKNIRKGESRLTFFKITSADEFKEYYELFKESRKELRFKTAPYSIYSSLLSNPYYAVFAVRSNESKKLVAGLGTIYNQNYILEVNAARDHNCFFANDYLKWMLLKYCHEQKILYYDFAGCNPDPESDSKDFNLRKFKEKWGGEFYYEYIFKR